MTSKSYYNFANLGYIQICILWVSIIALRMMMRPGWSLHLHSLEIHFLKICGAHLYFKDRVFSLKIWNLGCQGVPFSVLFKNHVHISKC